MANTILPTIYMRTDAGQEALVDSTPIIDRLEGLYADRPVRPPDGVLRFLDRLIDDFADIDGLPWSQPVFPYQVKCLQALRQTRLDLHPDARHTLDTALADTGCNPLF